VDVRFVSRWAALLFSSAVGVAWACGATSNDVDAGPPREAGASPALPPRICKAPSPGPAGFPWFTEVTAEVGLAETATLEPVAGSVIAADLDGDGFADLVTTAYNSQRGDPTTGELANKPVRFVFMSKADPQKPGNRIFVDATQASGLLATRDGAGHRGWGITNAGDLDDDGDVDLILCPADEITTTYSPMDPCDAFLNDGHGHFTLSSASNNDLDVGVHWYPSGALFDFDRDGFLDFWPATVAHWPYDPNGPNDEPPTLLRGRGDGTFENVSMQVGLPKMDGTLDAGTQWRHVFGVVACDIDGDGDDDMIFADYGREENQVWRNDNGTFTNVAHQLGVDYDDRTDYSDDQSYQCWCANGPFPPCNPLPPEPIVDCCEFCTQMHDVCPGTCPPTFRGWDPKTSTKPYSLGGNYFSFACGDINDDGFLDLVSATIQHGDVGTDEDPSELILNPGDGGAFTRPGNQNDGLYIPEPPARGLYWNHGDDMMVLVDVDLDGKKDIFSTTTGAYEVSDTHRLWRQTSSGPPPRFEEIEYPAGLLGNGDMPNLQGPAWIDIDGDGDLDLVAGETASPYTMHVYRNLVGQDQNWLRIRLQGGGKGKANTSAVGALVKVTAGGKTQTQYVSGGYGHGNVQADFVLTFGLGATCDVDEVVVRWPDASKTVSTYTNVLANYEVTIVEGAANVSYPK
jgi:enediyne biosynthesis protein E4